MKSQNFRTRLRKLRAKTVLSFSKKKGGKGKLKNLNLKKIMFFATATTLTVGLMIFLYPPSRKMLIAFSSKLKSSFSTSYEETSNSDSVLKTVSSSNQAGKKSSSQSVLILIIAVSLIIKIITIENLVPDEVITPSNPEVIAPSTPDEVKTFWVNLGGLLSLTGAYVTSFSPPLGTVLLLTGWQFATNGPRP